MKNNIKGITYPTYIVLCVAVTAVLERDHPNILTLQSVQIQILTDIHTDIRLAKGMQSMFTLKAMEVQQFGINQCWNTDTQKASHMDVLGVGWYNVFSLLPILSSSPRQSHTHVLVPAAVASTAVSYEEVSQYTCIGSTAVFRIQCKDTQMI